MPTSVLLAVLAAAGLLALAPALVRRYDATERLEAERAQPTARVLPRTRRRRTVPGRRPVNPSRVLVPTLRAAAPPTTGAKASGSRASGTGVVGSRVSDSPASGPRSDPPAGDPAAVRSAERALRLRRRLAVVSRSAPPATRPRTSPAIYRRRRILAALLLLNLVEFVGVVAVGPGFWVGFAVTGALLLAYLCSLRYLAVLDRRRRDAQARRERWLVAQQERVRQEQERRAAARRAAARRAAEQRESLRRTADGWSAPPRLSFRRASGDGSD